MRGFAHLPSFFSQILVLVVFRLTLREQRKGHVTRSNFSCNLQRNKRCVALQVARKNSRVTPHFATAIVALRVARKVERPSTFHNVARQAACV